MAWRELVKSFLLKRNMVLSRPPGQFSVTEWKLQQIKQRGLQINAFFDGGAARGSFTETIKQLYPEARAVLIEPRDDVQPQLKEVASRLSGLTIVKQLIGAQYGEVEYYEEADRSSMLKDADGKPFGTTHRSVVTTLDRLMDELNFAPDLIKLDVQGAELQVLDGGHKALASASAVLMEGSLIELQQGTPLLGEVIQYMRGHGFQLYDIFGLWHRPLDGALAQGDFFFLKNDHALLKDKRWDANSNATACFASES